MGCSYEEILSFWEHNNFVCSYRKCIINMPDLSILIPSRNEQFLPHTIKDILQHMETDTEVIAVIDGGALDPDIPVDSRVHIIQLEESIGQRAATNLACRQSTAKYVMKVDAHCAFDQGFDRKMIEAFAELGDNVTMVPIMRNLHVFDWVCPEGHRRYQGPSGPCKECGKPTTMDIVWIPKTNPQSTSYCFDSEPHFRYFNEYKKRPNYKFDKDFSETMSLQGSCWMLTRDKYWELDICDEVYGSWGSQGIQVACSTWLSGGRVVVNHRTWYGHCFRTQGGDFGFPYPLSGRQVEHAKQHARELFFENKWPKQIRPLSWLLERFRPVPGWSDEDFARISAAGAIFSLTHPSLSTMGTVVFPLADSTGSHELTSSIDSLGRRQFVSVDTVGLSTVDGGSSIRPEEVLGIGDQLKMGGITAAPVFAEMIKNGDILTASHGQGFNQPSIHESMNQAVGIFNADLSIPISIDDAVPVPASSTGIEMNSGKYTLDGFDTKAGDDKILGSHTMPPNQVSSRLEVERADTRSTSPTIIPLIHLPVKKGIVWYTDNRLDPLIMRACQNQLNNARKDYELITISLQPIDFGSNIVLQLERSILTMFRQQLAGIEASSADIIFLCEHDVLYHPSHFDFTPPRKDLFYYNGNAWWVRATDGHAVRVSQARAVSGLCASRDLLLEHYRKRVALVEKNGWSLRIGFEPGTHHRPERVDDYWHDQYDSAYPNLDVRHDKNASPTRWSKDQFRNQRYTEGWTEAEEVAPWYTKGKFNDMLRDLAKGR